MAIKYFQVQWLFLTRLTEIVLLNAFVITIILLIKIPEIFWLDGVLILLGIWAIATVIGFVVVQESVKKMEFGADIRLEFKADLKEFIQFCIRQDLLLVLTAGFWYWCGEYRRNITGWIDDHIKIINNEKSSSDEDVYLYRAYVPWFPDRFKMVSLSICTLGILAPAQYIEYHKVMISQIRVGDQKFYFNGTWRGCIDVSLINFALTILTCGLWEYLGGNTHRFNQWLDENIHCIDELCEVISAESDNDESPCLLRHEDKN